MKNFGFYIACPPKPELIAINNQTNGYLSSGFALVRWQAGNFAF